MEFRLYSIVCGWFEKNLRELLLGVGSKAINSGSVRRRFLSVGSVCSEVGTKLFTVFSMVGR